MTFRELADRLKAWGINARSTGYDHTRAFHRIGFKMGIGLVQFYATVCRSDDDVVYPPTIAAILDYFLILHQDLENPPEDFDLNNIG